jgi:uncharacterized protein
MEEQETMLPVIGSLLIGLTIGFLAQRSRMCFIGGFRDFLLIRDKDLLKGLIAFFTSAWLTIWILKLIGVVFPKLYNITNVKYSTYPSLLNALLSKFGLVSLLGGLGIGFLSVLAGGCPIRQHVLAGQGRVGSFSYLAGFYIGIVIYYFILERLIATIL